MTDLYIDELMRRADIVSVVSRYITLNKRGNTYVGLCPFHNEKTPSFHVSPEKNMYHCFGCGAGGSVINFLMQSEGYLFGDAVKILANESGMQPPEEKNFTGDTQKIKRIYEINKTAAKLYYEYLLSPHGKAALDYVINRGISLQIIKRFGLGFSPNSFDYLLKNSGYAADELFNAGLAGKNEKGNVYDRFINRLMFPIIDRLGNIIGFGGRVLDNSLPKYLNSPDTDVFKKSQNLFALNLAKKSKQDYFILAEGYIDVISLHQAGFDNAVASLGTALTINQAKLLFRYKQNITIAYDSDTAGQSATKRGIDILKNAGFSIKVLDLGNSKDPDEYIKENGVVSLQNQLEKTDNDINYLLSAIISKYDLNDDTQRIDFVKEACELISNIKNIIEREVFANKVAQSGKISVDAVLSEANRLFSKKIKDEKTKQHRSDISPRVMAQPPNRRLNYTNLASARAEEGIIALLYNIPDMKDTIAEKVSPNDFSSPELTKLFSVFFEYDAPLNIAELEQILTNDEIGLLSKITIEISAHPNPQAELLDYIEKIKSEMIKADKGSDEALLNLQKEKQNKLGGNDGRF